MDYKNKFTMHSFERSTEKAFIKHLNIGNYDFDLNYKPLKNPAELLKELILLKENYDLTNEEKINMVRKIVTKYME